MLPKPTLENLKCINNRFDFRCTDEELAVHKDIADKVVDGFNKVLKISTPQARISANRNLGFRPTDDENPYNAWYWICNIKDKNEGILANKKVGIKDNAAVAGIPMMIGSRVLEGFVPTYDATVVERILNAGGEIYGKTTCEDLCLSGSSYSTTYGPVRNPWNPEMVTGGSSSGSAAAVACGNVEMAIGGDQGGSIRIPSSFCGIVGMKPTFGLVPYTGIAPIWSFVDHAGPMARSVHDCALLLEAVAGYDDGKDSRQPDFPFDVPQYTKEMLKETTNIKIGLLKEAFDICQLDVVKCVKNAINLIEQSNKFLKIEEVSIPMHKEIPAIYGMTMLMGFHKQQVEGHGYGTDMTGLLHEQFSEKMFQGFKTRAHSLQPTFKSVVFLTGHTFDQGMGYQLYAKGSTLAYQLRKAYDTALETYDVLLLPTLPRTASKILSENDTLTDYVSQTMDMLDNVRSFNLTHHPALTLNAGYSELNQMPVGLQIVGKHWHDAKVLQVAAAVENILKHLQKSIPT